MDIILPTAPVAVVTIIGFLAPYAIGLLNGVLPFVKTPDGRKVVSIVVSLLLGAVALVAYFVITGAPWPASAGEWFLFAFLVIVVSQASYNFVTKDLGAKQIEKAVDPTL